MPLHFTAPETWKGGFFEVLIQPRIGSIEAACSLLKVLWSSPSLDGCYAERDCEPHSQSRIRPCENNINGHLYGLATLPNGKTVACGSYASHRIGAEGMAPSYRVGFYLPLGALSSAYNVGAYPFGSIENVAEWKLPLESFLRDIGRWIFQREPFDYALIGFEATPDPILLQRLRAGDIPDERNEGILWNDSGNLRWFPATRS